MLLMLPFSFEDNQTQRYPQASFAALATISINDVTHLANGLLILFLDFHPINTLEKTWGNDFRLHHLRSACDSLAVCAWAHASGHTDRPHSGSPTSVTFLGVG